VYDDGDNMLTKKQPWSNLFNDGTMTDWTVGAGSWSVVDGALREAMLQVEVGKLRFLWISGSVVVSRFQRSVWGWCRVLCLTAQARNRVAPLALNAAYNVV